MKKSFIVGPLTAFLGIGCISAGVPAGESILNQGDDPKVRTVSYGDAFDLENEDCKSTDFKKTGFGFVLTAKKNFNSSIFTNVDFVSGSSGNEVEVTYEAKYYESEGRVVLDVYEQTDAQKTDLLDTIEGLVTTNKGEADVIFADGEETIFLSQLMQDSALDAVGWWNNFCNWITGVVNRVKEVVVSGLRLMTRIAIKIIGRDGGASLLNMTKDSQGIYHAGFDCWQQYAGYNDFYDFVFTLGSKMSNTKNDFYDQNGDGYTDYILWGWKGDYWELGYGAELGIYKRFRNSELWYVDKNLAIDMTLKVDCRITASSSWKNIIDWNPSAAEGYSSKQWWITGFNPSYTNRKLPSSNLLRATYTVKFVTKGYSSSLDKALRESFKARWVDSSYRRWRYDPSSQVFSYSFI